MLTETGPNKINDGLPRSFDVLVSLIGLVVSAPLLLLSAVTVALTSPGGVLFPQQRVGRNGEMFVLYKLRTMRASNIGPQVTSSDDTRITRVGRLLRKTKLDELPTLWNVLKGDMALVGPRPEVPRYVNLENPMWQEVLATRPGITDPVTLRLRNEERLLAQVKGDPEAYYLNELQPLKLKGYVAYLEERSWRFELKVLWQTVAAIVVPRRSSTDFTDSVAR
jgi:lipopolysaccharide/colanic/teichoic acid biosynthesis glycosyltransferase